MDFEQFIARWTAREGGAERANYQGFLYDLCDLIGVGRPEVSGADAARNDYVFERAVRQRHADGHAAPRRIDLYKRGSFILEAKQSRLPGAKNALPEQLAPIADDAPLGRRSAARGWDVMMLNARRQAESYVSLLDPDHPAPPFVIVCDVGHCLELYADFSGSGRGYGHFPDRKGFRVYLEELRDPDVRARLAKVWDEPLALDPARESARVTREIAGGLAAVSKALETAHPAEEVAHFLMRCIFTMFAQSVDLLPKGSFTELLADCVERPASLAPLLDELWAKMDEPDAERRFSTALRAQVRHFNGGLFRGARAYPLGRAEIGELLAAARRNWTEVDPAIFGTLLEQALDRTERRRLGAHYTPRAYVQRLVDVTVMEPLRADWQAALTRAEAAKQAGDDRRAVAAARGFLRKLCATRVLDPACGTGNFLYVALEMMKALEGEVLETLARLGEPESMGLDRETVDPHQFLGLELNPRAAAIAELVVWIGYLQQHYDARTGHPNEPILRAFQNVNFGRREGYDAVLTWDSAPLPTIVETGGARLETYPNARRPEWPEAEFVVGNPPFIGGKDIRSRLSSAYAEALWRAHDQMNESADFVMYWWDRAADEIARPGSPLTRFGFVTTNSIAQVFQRRVMERRIASSSLHLAFAIADHPWTKAASDSAAVRIAMTVCAGGACEGRLWEVTSEHDLDTDQPRIVFDQRSGRIHPDLTIGADVTAARPLLAGHGLCSPGVKLHGSGFIVTADVATRLGLGERSGLETHIRPYRNGRDLTGRPRGVLVVDFFGLEASEVRTRYPEAYQHLTATVRYAHDHAGRPRVDRYGRKIGREWNNRESYKDQWWIFGEPRRELRPALEGLSRYIATVETAKHRVFQFLDASVVPDNMLIVIASCDAWLLSILSSRLHASWSLALGGWLGVGNNPRYSKSRTFDPFPFPDPSPALRDRLRAAGEELDALRKRVQENHPDITLTGLYNVLEKIRAGAALSETEDDVKRRGLVLILKELHETVDRLTLDAYGWPQDLADQASLARLVALNAERAGEEAAGLVRWLRADYQAPRSGKSPKPKSGALTLERAAASAIAPPEFPPDRFEQPLAVEAALAAAGRPLDAAALARAFRGRRKERPERVAQALATLALYGRVTALPDGRYAARRAA